MRLFNLLKKAFAKLGLISDYIVERYEEVVDGRTWEVTKYAGGKVVMECGFTTTSNVSISTLYANKKCYVINVWNVPDVLDSTKNVRIFGNIRGQGIDEFDRGTMLSTTQLQFYWCNSSAYTCNAGNGQISVMIIGTWGGVIRKLLFQGRWIPCGYSPC